MRWADGKMVSFDLETCSADPLTTVPVSFALVFAEAEQVTKVRHGLIDPEIPIPPEAMAIHGISDEDVKERGGNLGRSIAGIADELLSAQSEDRTLIVMNGAFDLTILDRCLKRLSKGEGLREMGWEGNVVDVSVVDRHVDRYRKGGRKLTDLCAHYGVELSNAHTAADDALGALLVARAIADEYRAVGDAEPVLLHSQQVEWRREWAEDFARYRAEKRQPPLEAGAGDWPIIGYPG